MTSVRYAGARSESCTLLDGSKEKCIFLVVQYESGVKMPVWRSKMAIITTTERKLLEAKSWGGSCKATRHRRHGPSQGNCSPSPHWRNGQVKRSMVGKELAFDIGHTSEVTHSRLYLCQVNKPFRAPLRCPSFSDLTTRARQSNNKGQNTPHSPWWISRPAG